LAFASDAAGLDGISERAAAFALDPSRVYLHRRGKYPRGSVAEGRVDGLLDDIAGAFLSLTHAGEKVFRRVVRGRDVYDGPETGRGPDLLLVSTPGFDLKGRLRAETVVAPRRLQGMHTWDDAFVVTRRPDLLPANRDVTLLDVPRMILRSLHVDTPEN
jgi:predicted AlkP superfamily phosphohydrolase/phosphomutase